MRASSNHPKRRSRGLVAGLVTTAVLALSVLGGSTALAANPKWVVGFGTDSAADPQPLTGASQSQVSAGKEIGFFEWLKNNDTANISQLYLDATTSPAATVVGAKWHINNASGSTVSSGTCPAVTPLHCTFGALNAGNTVYVEAAFTVGANVADGKTQSVTFLFNTTGTPGGKNNSHGDSKSITDSVTVAKNGDTDGDYNFNGSALNLADSQDVSPRNPQATSVSLAAMGVGGVVSDNASLTTPCNDTLTAGFPSFFSCDLLTSLTSTIEVGHGQEFNNPNGDGTPGIQVKVLFKKAPSQLGGSTPFVYHYWSDASGEHAELITATCTMDGGFPTNTGPCLIVGNNLVTVWLIHNGNMRM